ncbi:MAG: hypothetical protein D6732_13640 [Methanobacteriota archaeon]|nr:MAG: hypothetical protein D6732_13640 [Euryarchaeota archaeon]
MNRYIKGSDDMKEILDIGIVLLKSHLLLLLIVFVSYIIEKTTGLRLFIDHYTWVKSPENAETLTARDSFFYILVNLGVLLYHYFKGKIAFTWLSFFVWLILLGFLVRIFYKIHRRYQKVDPQKADDDYT